MIDLNEVGSFPAVIAPGSFSVRLGIYLPGIHSTDNFEVIARLIHSDDRFDPAVQTANYSLVWQAGSALDLWTITTPIVPIPGTSLGLPGDHLYRYELWWTSPAGVRQLISPWITDPFARAAQIGNMAAFTLDPAAPPFQWTDGAYKTPELDDLIVYELQVEEFNDTFDGVAGRLTYLQSLGVNCIELMPVYSMKLDFDWGYGPLYYFAPSARFGGPEALKRLVDAAHAKGIAVILDVVYEHVDTMFPYYRAYTDLAASPAGQLPTGPIPNPMMDGMNIYGFGPKPDFTIPLTLDYFQNVNQYWLDEFHIDGFRYDEVTDLYIPPMDAGYRTLVQSTYQYSFKHPRFQRPAGSWSRLIQTAEALDKAPMILSQSCTNAAWQNGLLYLAESVAGGAAVTDAYAHQLDPYFMGYPATTTATDSAGNVLQMPVAPFQYLESHDHSQLASILPGDRDSFYKLQPQAIALYTLQGIPMLWQGQEFADDYALPDTGLDRVHLERVTHWAYFYDSDGSPLISLYRRLGNLRTTVPALRSRSSFYFNQQSLQGTQVLIYSRHAVATAATAESWALVLLNFANWDSTVSAPFPAAGTWREMLDDTLRPAPLEVTIANPGDQTSLTVSSNYGQIWVKIA